MKNNLLWTVLLINLLAAGVFLGYVGMNPVEFRAIAPRMGEVITFGTLGTAQRVGVSTQNLPGGGKSTAAAGEEARTPPPAKRPPRRVEESGFPESDLPVAESRFLGPLSHPLEEQPPPIALYPFGVERRTYPTPNEMEVTILMRNLSGYHWEKATVVFKGADPKVVAQVFEVKDWMIDGYARFNYRFPKEQLKQRMDKLRLRAIYGDRSETTQSKMLNEERMALLGNLGEDAGAFYEAIGVADQKGGVLGVWAKATSVLQGGEKEETGPAEFLIAIPESHKRIASVPAPTLTPSTEERERILARHQQFLDQATATEKLVYELLDSVNTGGKDALTGEEGKARVAAIVESRKALDETGLDLSLQVGRSKDAEVKQLTASISAVSDSIITLFETATAQMKYLDPTFNLEPQEGK